MSPIKDRPTPETDSFFDNPAVPPSTKWANHARNIERQKAALREALIECAAFFQLDQFRSRPVYAKDSEVGRRMLTKIEETLTATKPTQ